MKRFHVHVSVGNLDQSIRFYSALFAAQPTVRQSDYAKWMLDDPRINFAISTHRQPAGVNHLGFQVDSGEELRGMHVQLQAADSQLVQENEQACCYARSDIAVKSTRCAPGEAASPTDRADCCAG